MDGGEVGAKGIARCDGSVWTWAATAMPGTVQTVPGTSQAAAIRIARTKRDPPANLFVLVAEMSAHDARLEILERAQILDDIAAGIVEKQLTIFRAADCDYPLEIVPVLQQIIDGLRHAATRDDGDLRSS